MVYVAPDIFDEIAICPERLVFGPDGNGDETLSRLQVEANARLIAAAPDLLKACIAQSQFEAHTVNCARCCNGGLCSTGFTLHCKAMDLREDAIAKAEGSDVA
jgi:hypothetical protein